LARQPHAVEGDEHERAAAAVRFAAGIAAIRATETKPALAAA